MYPLGISHHQKIPKVYGWENELLLMEFPGHVGLPEGNWLLLIKGIEYSIECMFDVVINRDMNI